MVKKISLINYNSLNDFLFYKYLCEEGNEKQQKIFLEAIGVPIKGNLKIISQTISPDTIDNKKCILDFLGETNDTFINIELQQNETSDFNERIAYYMNRIAKLKKGKEYTEFKDVVLISIVNFNMNDLPNYKHEYMFINSKNLNDIFTDKLKLIIIELKKFQEIEKDLKNKEHLYLSFFDENTDHKRRVELGKMDEGLKSAVKKIEEALQDDNAVRIYHKLEYEKMIRENEKIRIKKEKEEIRNKSRKEGRKEGIEEGMEIKNIQVARNLKNLGISVQDIAKATGLSQKFIKNL